MMSVERSFEAWEEVQRHGQDLADRLAQGFTGLIHSHIAPPSFSWPNPSTPKLFEVEFPTKNFTKKGFGLSVDNSTINGVTAIFDIGNRIGQVGADFGMCLNGVVQQFFRHLPLPFRHDENVGISMRAADNGTRSNMGITQQEDLRSLEEQFKGYGFSGNSATVIEGSTMNESIGVGENALNHLGRSKMANNPTNEIHTKKRNRLEHQRLNDLVYIQYNRKIATRFQKRRELGKDFNPLVLEDFQWDNEWVNGEVIDPIDDDLWEAVDEALDASRNLEGRRTRRRVGSSSQVDDVEMIEDRTPIILNDDEDVDDDFGHRPNTNDERNDENSERDDILNLYDDI
ncbi:hypothetical protein OROMI_017322 [Orobanche minor]